MRRTAMGVLGSVLLTACTAGVVSTALPASPTPAEAALIERIVDDASGGRPDLRRLRIFAASDGSQIAFLTDRTGPWEIWIMNADGTEQSKISTETSENLQPEWSADGTQLLFMASRERNFDIYVVNGRPFYCFNFILPVLSQT